MRRQGTFPCRRLPGDQADCSSEAAAVIGAGGVVAIPTETSYGLAVDPFNSAALHRLFRVKNRPPSKAVLVLIDSIEMLPRLARRIPPRFTSLIDAYWPGPLTLIFPARNELPQLLTAGSGTVGIRISSHPLAGRICQQAGGAITATSANISSRKPARSADEIIEIFHDRIDIVVDAGALDQSRCSTVVSLNGEELVLIREGVISAEELQRSWGLSG